MDKHPGFISVFLIILFVLFAVMAGNIPLQNYLSNLMEQGYYSQVSQTAETGSLKSLNLPIWQEYFFLFFPFIMGLSVLMLCYPLILKQPMETIIGPNPSFRWGIFFRGAGLWLLLAMSGDIILAFIKPDIYQWNFQPQKWLKMNFWLLIFIPLQASAEEGFFRGFLMDVSGAWRGKATKALLFQGTLFTLAHMGNPEIREYGWYLMLPQYLMMALFFGYLTLKDRGLERALGVHIINNWYGISLVNLKNSAVPSDSMVQVVDYRPLLGAVSLTIAISIFLVIQSLKEKIQPQKS